MNNKKIDVLIIGAGPAGVAAGIGARKEGADTAVYSSWLRSENFS